MPWRARELARVREHAVAVAVVGRVLALRVDDRLQHLDRVELVLADAAREQLVLAGRGVEAPRVAGLHERERERKVVVADRQLRRVAVARDRVLRVVRGDEALAARAVGDAVARRERAGRVPEHRAQRRAVVRLDRLHERGDGVLRASRTSSAPGPRRARRAAKSSAARAGASSSQVQPRARAS